MTKKKPAKLPAESPTKDAHVLTPPVHWTEWKVHGVNPRGRRPANDPHEVIRAFECECDADGIGAVRIELLRSVATPSRYRLRLSRLELYRLKPRLGPGGEAPIAADEEVWVDWTFALSRDHKEAFETDSDRAATAVALDTLRAIVTDIDQARSCVP